MQETITVAIEGEVAVVTLDRPEVLNAVNRVLARDLAGALADLGRDAAVHAVVLTGAGQRAFCSGVDLEEARSVEVREIEEWFGGVVDLYRAILTLDAPVVAALNGVAAGAGFQMALVSDLRVGHPGTRMGQPEVNAGIPSIMGSYWMSFHLPRSLNQDLSMTGRLMDADECRRVGLLNYLVEAPDLLPRAVEVARDLGAKPPIAFRRTKQHFRESALAGIDAAFRSGVLGQQEAYANGEPQAIMERFAQARGRRGG